MVCFGASENLEKRLQELLIDTWKSIIAEPCTLFAIVIADLHHQVDEEVWAMNDIVGGLETVLDICSMTKTKTDEADRSSQ